MYDGVNKEILCKVLERIGLSIRIIKIIKSMYKNVRAKYRLEEIETD